MGREAKRDREAKREARKLRRKNGAFGGRNARPVTVSRPRKKMNAKSSKQKNNEIGSHAKDMEPLITATKHITKPKRVLYGQYKIKGRKWTSRNQEQKVIEALGFNKELHNRATKECLRKFINWMNKKYPKLTVWEKVQRRDVTEFIKSRVTRERRRRLSANSI